MASSSVTRRPSGKWRARYRDDTGREHAKHFDTRTAGQRWLDEVTTSKITGNYVDPASGKITFRQFYDEWSARQIWESSTVAAMSYAARSATFADVEIGRIRRSHIESWVKLMSRSLAPGTIKTRLKNVRQIFRAAVADRIIGNDPTIGVRLPALRRAEAAMSIPTPEQVGALIEAADNDLAPVVTLCAYAGLREGEAAAVQVGDIDFLRRTIQVLRQVQYRSGAMEVRRPKYGSERTVFVPDDLLMILSEHIAHRGIGGQPDAWLFTDTSGTRPPRANRINTRWHAIQKRAGITGVRLHDLRHYFASALLAAGVDIVAVSKAMGHSSASITLDVYAHLMPSAEDRTRAAIADAMTASADRMRTAGTGTPYLQGE